MYTHRPNGVHTEGLVFKDLQELQKYLENYLKITIINYRVTPEGNNEFAGWARMAQVSINCVAS